MAPGRKQGGGCWTCRLRRKRCDSIQPICGNCQDLEIICHSDKARPPWMDGAAEQKHMSEAIKERIKQNAILRRERRATSRAGASVMEYVLSTDSAASTLNTSSVAQAIPQSSINRSDESQPSITNASSTSTPITLQKRSPSDTSGQAGFAVPIQVELGSVMTYLDYVFPFLFPFHQPSLMETGRQWLLGLLCQNEVSFHIAASLSAYFFSIVSQNEEPEMHDECKALVYDRLVEQMDMALISMQKNVSAISHHESQSLLLDKARIMEEITQLLLVEVTVQRNVDWKIHLNPALVLFDEIFKKHGMNHLEPSLAILLEQLPSSFPMATPHQKPLPNTADQVAFSFFVSLLLFIDIMASVSLGTSPILQGYHQNLLSFHSEQNPPIRFEAIVGCQNWALVAIGNISALCVWKRDAKQSGNFSVVNLVSLAGHISQNLENGLTSLDTCPPYLLPNTGANRLAGYYSRHDGVIDHTSIASVTRIWAYAAKLYLSVSLSGWQTNSADIQVGVAKVLSRLQAIDSPAQLRSLSWPFCVAGCLALPGQEHDFRSIVLKTGHLGEFGTLLNALRIMEAVWSSRDTVDGDIWGITSCLNILGSPVFLL
ncbi:hypothetical protein K431DRAFT_287952 [Polychaeton citri CBS 116435]|uniref:Zn(2)-C6 fungal-type domain-containing protein n=1 Tax=Polychaeton citri CBS 116435 TaxID=1314669 RepID=A0A9P4Q4C6_9PEZI|nr:hypothetical protein K431DRAFT_287952 [Polychaeton citri CBS 116435]